MDYHYKEAVFCQFNLMKINNILRSSIRLPFGFDYRGFADNEGEKGGVLLEEQLRDIKHH
jgi:hypothetical protein